MSAAGRQHGHRVHSKGHRELRVDLREAGKNGGRRRRHLRDVTGRKPHVAVVVMLLEATRLRVRRRRRERRV